MGSWANTLHVRNIDAGAVTRTVREILLANGYEIDVGQYKKTPAAKTANIATGSYVAEEDDSGPQKPIEEWTEEDFRKDDEEFERTLSQAESHEGYEDEPPPEPEVRKIILYRPHNGWATILDSAGLGSDLAEQLSRSLSTDAASFYVNDSTSWGYELIRAGTSLDSFDSSDETDDSFDAAGAMSPELLAAIEREDEAAIERLMEKELMRHAPRGPIVFPGSQIGMPPAMALLKAKIAEGKAGFGDRLRYGAMWIQFQFQKLWSRLYPSAFPFGYDVPPVQEMDTETLAAHVAAVRRLFPNADGNALTKLLPQSRFPAEELQREFFQIVGLPPICAYLSYEYRGDFGKRELTREGLVEQTKLRFVKGPPAPDNLQ